MVVIKHNLRNLYAIPKHHPITCANPAPWRITEVKLSESFDRGVKVSIRGEESMWFNADNCWIGDEEEMTILAEMLEQKRRVASLTFSYDTNNIA